MGVVLVNCNCVTPLRVARHRTVVIRDGTIEQIAGPGFSAGSEDELRDLGGRFVLPGLIDVHAHGALGHEFADEDLPVADTVRYLHSHGVTGLLPTLHPRPMQQFKEAMERMADRCLEGPAQRLVLGIHSEGPFLNPEMCGGADKEAFCRPTKDAWRELQEAACGQIKMVTLAPELDGAMSVIRGLVREGVAVSGGHSNASYDVTMAAVEQGLSMTTHTFNAMEGLSPDRPNILLAALREPELSAQLNAEGVHVHPIFMRMLYRLKGARGVIVTSDLHPGAGLAPGTHTAAGFTVETDGEIVRYTDGTIVGSALPLDQSVRTMVQQVGVPLTEAARMASLNPARSLGLAHRKGKIAPGYDADLAVMDEDLQVKMTVAGGQVVYET